MIKIENVVLPSEDQWNSIIMGARNPLNSWSRSDSGTCMGTLACHSCKKNRTSECNVTVKSGDFIVGPNDYDLMKRLRNAGTDHRKFMRMITVYLDITAPLYWWKEFDTYKVGTVVNSCSTMHTIHAKEFTLEDFSCEHLNCRSISDLQHTIDRLNRTRDIYLYGGFDYDENDNWVKFEPKSKYIWWQMIQLLPSSYNQKRTVMCNYEVLCNMYKSRRNHKLDCWHTLCDWMETLPYSELITGEKE